MSWMWRWRWHYLMNYKMQSFPYTHLRYVWRSGRQAPLVPKISTKTGEWSGSWPDRFIFVEGGSVCKLHRRYGSLIVRDVMENLEKRNRLISCLWNRKTVSRFSGPELIITPAMMSWFSVKHYTIIWHVGLQKTTGLLAEDLNTGLLEYQAGVILFPASGPFCFGFRSLGCVCGL
jgi:hypothetical protein